MIVATYESDLTTMMTIQPKEIPIRSLSDIIKLGKKVIVQPNTSHISLLKNAPVGHPLNTIFKSMDRGQYLDNQRCLDSCMEALLEVRCSLYI